MINSEPEPTLNTEHRNMRRPPSSSSVAGMPPMGRWASLNLPMFHLYNFVAAVCLPFPVNAGNTWVLICQANATIADIRYLTFNSFILSHTYAVAFLNKFQNKCFGHSDRRGGSSASNTRKDEYNWGYDADDLSEEVLRTSTALENIQLDRKARNLTTSWRLGRLSELFAFVPSLFLFFAFGMVPETWQYPCRHPGNGAE